MKLNKKMFLTIGTTATIIAPLATVVACTATYDYSQNDIELIQKLKSPEFKAKMERVWIKKVLSHEYGVTGDKTINFDEFNNQNANNPQQFKDDFIETLRYYVAERLRKDDNFFITIKNKVASLDKSIVKGDDGKGSNAWKALTQTTSSNVDISKPLYEIEKKNTLFEDTNKDALKTVLINIFYNKQTQPTGTGNDKKEFIFDPFDLGVKTDILKLLVTKKYLSKTRKQFKAVFPSRDIPNGLDRIDVDETTKNFPLLLESVKKKLGYEFDIKLDEDKTLKLRDVTSGNKMKDINKWLIDNFDKTGTNDILGGFNISDQKYNLLPKALLKNSANLKINVPTKKIPDIETKPSSTVADTPLKTKMQEAINKLLKGNGDNVMAKREDNKHDINKFNDLVKKWNLLVVAISGATDDAGINTATTTSTAMTNYEAALVAYKSSTTNTWDENATTPPTTPTTTQIDYTSTIFKMPYAGIKPMTGSSRNLSTAEGEMKKVSTDRIGVLSDQGYVIDPSDHESEVTIYKDNKLDLKFVIGILPSYRWTKDTTSANKDTETLSFENNTVIKTADAMDAILTNDPDIFTDAMEYFTTIDIPKDNEKPILLKVNNTKIRDILLDEGFRFIEKG